MLVQDVMSTGVVTARRNESVRSVGTKMLSRHCGAIPVVEDGELLIGLVTLRDVLIPLYPNYGEYIHDTVHSRDFLEMEDAYADVLSQRVEEVMSVNPLTVAPRTPVLEAASYMGVKNFRRTPVVENGTVVGMVSVRDINRGLFFERGHAALEHQRAAQPSGYQGGCETELAARRIAPSRNHWRVSPSAKEMS